MSEQQRTTIDWDTALTEAQAEARITCGAGMICSAIVCGCRNCLQEADKLSKLYDLPLPDNRAHAERLLRVIRAPDRAYGQTEAVVKKVTIFMAP